jgi:Holliday junction resolvase YEN1
MSVLQAPGEAKAELGSLNKLGQIDAVLTQDSDALVFRVRCILKR